MTGTPRTDPVKRVPVRFRTSTPAVLELYLETLGRRKAEMANANELIVERTNRRWVAKQLGISYGTFNQLAYGHAPIHSIFKSKLAEFLGLPVEDVFPHGAERV